MYKIINTKYQSTSLTKLGSTSIILDQINTIVLVQTVASMKTMLFLAKHVNLLEFKACPMEKP